MLFKPVRFPFVNKIGNITFRKISFKILKNNRSRGRAVTITVKNYSNIGITRKRKNKIYTLFYIV